MLEGVERGVSDVEQRINHEVGHTERRVIALTRLGHVVIAEGETSVLGGAWPLLNAVKAARTGLALQPEQSDGAMVYKTDFPRSRRGDFPPGRGLLVEGGKVCLLQVALPE